MRPEGDCYVKVLVHKPDNNRVVGFHICAPNAGEVTQGVGIAMKCGVTKELLDSCVGIIPPSPRTASANPTATVTTMTTREITKPLAPRPEARGA